MRNIGNSIKFILQKLNKILRVIETLCKTHIIIKIRHTTNINSCKIINEIYCFQE